MGELEETQPPDSDAASPGAPRLRWDASVEAIPLARGWDAEPCIVDWFGTGQADLLVSSGGGPHGRSVWLYRPLGASSRARLPATTQGSACRSSTVCGACVRSRMIAPAGSTWWRWATTGWSACPTRAPRRNRSSAAGSPLGLGADLGIAHARIVQMTAVDWDQDGLTDLLVGVLDVTGYWPDSGRLPPTQQVGLNQKAGHPCYDRQGLWRGRAPSGHHLLASQRRASG